MQSALYTGWVRHRRLRPRAHSFRYPLFMALLDLAELREAFRGRWLWGVERRAFVSFRRADHVGDPARPLDECVRELVGRETGRPPAGPVRLLTHLRFAGYVFNPVSFWVCHDDVGAVRAVLCEVRNTFGERHNYLVAAADGAALVSGAACTTRKMFHVSPFCDVKGDYRFRFAFGAERWLARIDYFDRADATDPLLETWISGAAAPIDRPAVRRLWWRYRFFTVGVVARIHWQALKLAFKRVPFFTKPAPPREETTR